MAIRFWWLPLLVLLSACGPSYEWEALQSPTRSHLRGLSVVNDSIVWASGTNGTVIMTTNAGSTWKDVSVQGADSLDFRDIHATDRYCAWVLSSGNGVNLYRTDNGGQSWYLQHGDPRPAVFFDGFDFTSPDSAVAYGDPQLGKMAVLTTTNGGDDWLGVNNAVLPPMLQGEAGFAASGTGICVIDSRIWIATGNGPVTRVFASNNFGESWRVYQTPIPGGEATGIFSMAFADTLTGVVVGGNYLDSANTNGNCAVTRDGGKSWQLVQDDKPNGYRSCVAVSPDGALWLTVGRTGSEYSNDGGASWQPISQRGYYTCQVGSTRAFASGRGGRLARMVIR